MVVYLDVLFGVNVLMDYATLLAASRLGGVRVKRRRLLLAAAVGGLYAVASIYSAWTAFFPIRILAGIGLCAIAFAKQTAFARLCGLYLLVSAAFAGLAAGLGMATGRQLLIGAGYYAAIPLRVLLLAGAVGYMVSGVWLRGDALHGVLRREVETLTICFDGKEQVVRVLQDTGNGLAEPITGKPVVVLGRAVVQKLLGTEVQLDDKGDAVAQLAQLPPVLVGRFGLLPYHAVGTENGLLLYFRPDFVRRASGASLDCVCAVGPADMGQGVYDGLIGV